MNISSIKEARDLAPETPIDSLTFFLGRVSKLTSGVDQKSNKPTTFQAGEAGGGGTTMEVLFNNVGRDLSPLMGKQVRVNSLNKGGRVTGLKVKTHNYKGNQRLVLWVTSSANIFAADGDPAPAAAPTRAMAAAGMGKSAEQPSAPFRSLPADPSTRTDLPQDFTRSEAQAIGKRAQRLSKGTSSPYMARIYCALAIACDNLDAHLLRASTE